MKVGTILIIILVLFGCMAVFSEETATKNAVIAQDSTGMLIMVKEQYGCSIIDTCTVLMIYRGNFIVVHKAAPSAWYPTAFHSVRVIRKFSEPADTAGALPQALTCITDR